MNDNARRIIDASNAMLILVIEIANSNNEITRYRLSIFGKYPYFLRIIPDGKPYCQALIKCDFSER